MSLISSLYSSFSGLRTSEAQMSTVSSNISNADKTGYTRKVYEASYSTGNGVSVPTGGIVTSTVNKYLYAATIDDVSDVGYSSTVSSYLDTYSSNVGTTEGSGTINNDLDDLQNALEALATSPEDQSQKIIVVNAASLLASSLNTLSDTVQDQRLQANQEISDSIDTINSSLSKIDEINKKISVLKAQGASTADLEDERMVALETLAEQIDVQYFITSEKQLKIYTTGGQPLLDSQPHSVSYSEATSVTGETVYPGGFSGIMLNGQDITTSVNGGVLGGLIELRDTILVQEQDKLDEFANILSDTLNQIFGAGSSYPATPSITGVEQVSGADSLSATGTLRIATVNSNGIAQTVTDIDLSAYATIDDLVSALDGLTDISASLDGSGHLVLSSENGQDGVAFNVMDSSIGPDGENFSSYFGLNTLFQGDGAENIRVSKYLSSNPEGLSTALLSSSAGLAAGDRALSSGDTTLLDQATDIFNGSVSFGAAGNFSAKSVSFSSYINQITSNIALRASNANDDAETTQLLYNQSKSLLTNQSGVNLDEETARLVDLENKYNSAALMISTIQDLFDRLLEAVA